MTTRLALAWGGLSGLLMALAFPPFALWPLGWIGLAPVLFALTRITARQTVLAGLVFGAVYAAVGMHWLAVTAWVNLIAVTVYFSLFYGGALVLLRAVVRRDSWIRPVAAAAAWVGLDLLIGRLFTGIPWMLAGYAQTPLAPIVQIADVTGVHGVTFLGALSSALLAFGAGARAGARVAAMRRALPLGVVWAVAVAAAWGYGADRLGRFSDDGATSAGPELLLVQPNIPQALKDTGEAVELEEVFLRNHRLTVRALAVEPRPDLVVWAETMNPIWLLPLGDGTWEPFEKSRWFYREKIRRDYRTALLLGSLYKTRPPKSKRAFAHTPYHNSAQFFSANGEPGPRYDKMHPIPWAEYIPLGLTFIGRWIEEFTGFPPMLMVAGEDAVVFPFGDSGRWSFGASICFDLIYPRYVRQSARGGARFLVNLTNEAWFGTSAEFDQLLAMARFRAIENRMGVVRATNSGISASIDRAGRVVAKVVDAGGRDRAVQGVLRCRPSLREGLTIYSRAGEVFGVCCAVFAMITALLGTRRRAS